MHSHARALEWLAPHCDLERRLGDVPWDARVRGVYYNALAAEMESGKHFLHAEYSGFIIYLECEKK